MRSASPPSASAVRVQASAIVAAYAVPLVLIAATASAACALGTLDWRVPALVATCLALGMSGPVARRAAASRRERRRPRKPVGGGVRAAILASAPELSRLVIVVRGTGHELGVDGRRLLIGMGWVGGIGAGRPLPPGLAFALAHEARHLAVGTATLTSAFRLLKAGYVVLAGATYSGLLVNVAAIVDDPDRVALTFAAILAPFVFAASKVVLDVVADAFEWRLEIDADAAAVAAHPLDGRDVMRRAFDWSAEGVPGHVPLRLRSAAIDGHPVSGKVALTLAAGWLCLVVPTGMSVAFAWPGFASADLLNASLAAFYSATACAAGVAAVTATRLPSDGALRGPSPTACDACLRLHALAMRLLGWVMVAAALVALANLIVEGRSGPTCSAWTFTAVGAAGSAVAYLGAAHPGRRGAWVVAAAVAEACRLWLTSLILRASGVLPYYDDVEGLGRAMREHADLVGDAAARMVADDPGWAFGVAAASSAAAASTAVLILRCRSAARRRRPDGQAGGW